MRSMRNSGWTRRGCSLLWSSAALAMFAAPSEVVSLRGLFALARGWPDELPSNDGRALVVAGVEGCLDTLSPADAETWLERDLKPRVLSFQDAYEGGAALVLWLPGGRTRVRYSLASGEYTWSSHGDSALPLGRLLWAGAQADAERIVVGDATVDADGDGWAGMYHPRIS